ncbi:MAG: EamA/RhaT family transporter [Planctomycetota bacterium]|nr:MAG: EamA/RhaT family transporter [Planctomycetota bacterium]
MERAGGVVDGVEIDEFPWYLVLPLLASVLFVCGLLFVKAAGSRGVRAWTVTFWANQWSALLFSSLWLLGGTIPDWSLWWQPVGIAVLFLLGQALTFATIEHGDVSVATPILGSKVILVACLLALLVGQPLRSEEWWAVGLATLGVGLVQWVPRRRGDSVSEKADQNLRPTHRPVITALLALLASLAFAAFDVAVQSWSPNWGPGRIIPLSFWIVALFSWVIWPAVQSGRGWPQIVKVQVMAGTWLIALQALCIVYTLSAFGDAARVNVVYAVRGMWGVLLAWWVARMWGGSEAEWGRSVMLVRLAGAGLLSVAVALVILAAA